MATSSSVGRWRGDWTAACPLSRLEPQRGVAVLLPDGTQVALFRLADDSIRAVGNIDPIGRAAVLSRGIVGDRGGIPVVATRTAGDGTIYVATSPDIRFGSRRALSACPAVSAAASSAFRRRRQ